MALRNLTTVDLVYLITCEDPAWIGIHWNSILWGSGHIWLHWRACDHTTWVWKRLGMAFGNFLWALTISWSRLLARVWSGLDEWRSTLLHVIELPYTNMSTFHTILNMYYYNNKIENLFSSSRGCYMHGLTKLWVFRDVVLTYCNLHG